MVRWALLGGLVWLIGAVPVVAGEVTALRSSPEGEATRVVIETRTPAAHRLFTLTNPDRVVVDLEAVSVPAKFSPTVTGELLQRVRFANRQGSARIVLDLNRPATLSSFVLSDQGAEQQRLVIDLQPKHSRADTPSPPAATRHLPPPRPFTVVIDPGHGGIDPGAQGPGGTWEKEVVLGIGVELKRMIDAQPGMRAILTRSDDRFLQLRERVAFAHQHEADLFVSLHANSYRSPKVHGSAVYAVSEKGASSEAARLLAAKENAADLVGGIALEDKDDLLASVLLDLSQNATVESSLNAAAHVLHGLGTVNKTHREAVQQAGFVVLKSPDIPSILVETAFITNPEEERKLASRSGQRQFAQGVLAGIKSYHNELPKNLFAARADYPAPSESHTYRVQRGDTLTAVARRHGVALHALRAANPEIRDLLRAGETLLIPEPQDG